ncbi:MAG: non-ribosomal peptide synthetase module [Vallitaleaceae bacterium]|nr:non-ribosomal peptide synthetase module [Vallitaleaceae bacterium]
MLNQDTVIEAFKIFAKLSAEGEVKKSDARLFVSDDEVRGLVSQFAGEVDCTILSAGDDIFMVPLTKNSIYHLTNDQIKRDYLPSRALNMDIYILYLLIVVFIGEFYDSYQTPEPTRDFISTTSWLESVNERIEGLKQLGEERLKELEMTFEYNWLGIIKRWDAMDNIKENVVRQTAHSNVRLSHINHAKKFLIAQKLVQEIGMDELALTQKAKVIVQKYYMEYEYNRGILEVIYGMEHQEGEAHANDL